MTAKCCDQARMPQRKRSLRSALAVVAWSTIFIFSVGVHKSNAKIIESVTEKINHVELGKGGANCQKVETTSTFKRGGQKAFKHWIDRCGERAEMKMKRTKIGGTYWYGWSMFIPSDWQDTSAHYDIVNQWATAPTMPVRGGGTFKCGANGSHLARQDDTFYFIFQRQGDSVDVKCTKYPLAKVSAVRGKWIDFVMHVKWTGNKDGFLKLWIKAGDRSYTQEINYKGRTFWNDEGTGPYFKMGLYKGEPGFKGPAPRYLYTDEYRLGDANSSFEQVAPRFSRVKQLINNTLQLKNKLLKQLCFKFFPSF